MTKVIGVRFRSAGKIYFFSPGKYEIKKGDHVIVETARGVDIDVTPSGIVTFLRLMQPVNAHLPIFVTLSGIVTLTRLLQQANALLPISVTLPGIVTLTRLLQPENA